MSFLEHFFRNNWKKIAVMIIGSFIMYMMNDRKKQKSIDWDDYVWW